MAIPNYDSLFNPLLKALQELGGSGSVSEISEKVAEILELSENDINTPHPGQGYQSQLDYRLAWARTYLKKFGLLENSSRGIWAFTTKGHETSEVNKDEVVRYVRNLARETELVEPEVTNSHTTSKLWEELLIEKLTQLTPQSFERLCQRILRESGFVQVEVTGRSGDGGVDGTGIIKIGGLLSFHVIFQCKRYSGTVGSQQIRDFRGAMVGRTDKGLFITTGLFTRDARAEATRDGAPPIDLIDGNDLAKKMKELKLGVLIQSQESVVVDNQWFETM